jgi:hypothetical protein
MKYSVYEPFGYEIARVEDRAKEFQGDWTAYASMSNFGAILTLMARDEVATLQLRFQAVRKGWPPI